MSHTYTYPLPYKNQFDSLISVPVPVKKSKPVQPQQAYIGWWLITAARACREENCDHCPWNRLYLSAIICPNYTRFISVLYANTLRGADLVSSWNWVTWICFFFHFAQKCDYDLRHVLPLWEGNCCLKTCALWRTVVQIFYYSTILSHGKYFGTRLSLEDPILSIVLPTKMLFLIHFKAFNFLKKGKLRQEESSILDSLVL